MFACISAARSRAVMAIAMCSVVCAFHFAPMSLLAQVPLPMMTPRVDTLWTHAASSRDFIEYQASDIGGADPVMVAAISLNSGAGPRRQRLVVYDVRTGDSLRSFEPGHQSSIRDVVFAGNGSWLATAEHGRIKLWNWPSMDLRREFIGSAEALPRVLLSHDGCRLYSNIDGVMYDTELGDTLWRFVTVFAATKARPMMTPDERFIATVRTSYLGARDVGVLLDASTGLIADIFHGGRGQDQIASIAVSDDARYVAVTRLPATGTRAGDGSCVVYDRDRDSVIRVIDLIGDPDTDGMRCRFLPANAGLLLYRNVSSDRIGDYLYPIAGGEPHVVWWPFFEQRFTRDWLHQFGANGRHAWVGPFAFPRASVALPPDQYAVMCVDDAGMMHIRGLDARYDDVFIEIDSYDGRHCMQTEAKAINGTCTANVSALHGPMYVSVTHAGRVVLRAPCMMP